MKVQVITNNITKEDRLCMKSPPPEAYCAKSVFQIQPPTSGVNFLNNISIPKVRVNRKKIEHDTTYETINLKDISFHNSIE